MVHLTGEKAMKDHENIREVEDPKLVARNTRIGLILFAVYSSLYASFILLTTFDPKIMQTTPFGGVNLAILSGFGLIASALILAVIYLYLAARPVVKDN
jgi:uncharacterized membrane protein (DUF485 family)